MANKVDVFTEELSKVFTILQQQYVMIKYMKALITSGELDETEINKLKEQVKLINNQIQHINEKMVIIQNDITDINKNINTIINDQIVPIKQNIERIEQGLSEIYNNKVDKVAKTDKWQLYGVGTEQFPLPNGDTIDMSSKLVYNTVINRDVKGRAQIEYPVESKDIANKEYVDNTVASAGGGGKLYRHDLAITSMNDLYVYHTIYSTNNTPITNDEIFATVVKPNSDYGGQGVYIAGDDNIKYAIIRYSTSNVIVQTSRGSLIPSKSITDTVTPV